MRIFLLSEGVTDLGRNDSEGSFPTDGVLQHLIRKLLHEINRDIEVHFTTRKRGVRLFSIKERMGRSQHGFANRLIALLGLKEGREADAIVMVVDRDSKKNKDRIVELNKGREQVLREKKPCAVGIAIEEIEAWLLADEKALRTALNDPTIQRQPDPESLDSRDESSEKNPKGRLERIMSKALGHEIRRKEFPDLYASIAEAAELETLRVRCPEGFQPFALQVHELAGGLEHSSA